MNISTENSSKIKVNGIEISYARIGNGPQTLLLLSGFLGTSDDFKPLVQYLDRQKYTMIAWDPPGCGRSRPPDVDFSPGFLHRDAAWAISLMEALRIDKYSVLGWCQGGSTALIVAAAVPDRVEKLAVWSCNAYVTDGQVAYYETIREMRDWPRNRMLPMFDRYGEEYASDSWRAWVDAHRNALRDNGGDVCRGELSRVRAPTLVLHGAEDGLVPHEHAVYIHENVAGSTLKIFPDGKHLLHFMPDDSFNSAVDKFLTRDHSSN